MVNYDSVMLDLETMGTGSNAAIIAIGAFKFDSSVIQKYENVSDEQKFYYPVHLGSSVDFGGEVDTKTIMWWMDQPSEVRQKVKEGVHIKSVLGFFDSFIRGKEYALFGNGSNFDNVILRNAYERLNWPFLLSYKRDMCYRTIRNMFGNGIPYEFKGTPHYALDDAINQGIHLQKILNQIGTIK